MSEVNEFSWSSAGTAFIGPSFCRFRKKLFFDINFVQSRSDGVCVF